VKPFLFFLRLVKNRTLRTLKYPRKLRASCIIYLLVYSVVRTVKCSLYSCVVRLIQALRLEKRTRQGVRWCTTIITKNIVSSLQQVSTNECFYFLVCFFACFSVVFVVLTFSLLVQLPGIPRKRQAIDGCCKMKSVES